MEILKKILAFLSEVFLKRGFQTKALPKVFPINIVPLEDNTVGIVLPDVLEELGTEERNKRIRYILMQSIETIQQTLRDLDKKSVRLSYGQ